MAAPIEARILSDGYVETHGKLRQLDENAVKTLMAIAETFAGGKLTSEGVLSLLLREGLNDTSLLATYALVLTGNNEFAKAVVANHESGTIKLHQPPVDEAEVG